VTGFTLTGKNISCFFFLTTKRKKKKQTKMKWIQRNQKNIFLFGLYLGVSCDLKGVQK
jgi:hypothetical protein